MANSVHTQNNKSQFHKTVCLYEWWLTWAYNQNHGKRLAIAGYTSRDQQALQIFYSAPILKRHDVFTLETTDGIYVMISGYINITRTAENGFPPEMISNYFLFGFPLHWEACSEFFLAQGSDSNGVFRDSKLDEDHAYRKKTAAIEMGRNLKDETVIKKADTCGNKISNNVSNEDASFRGGGQANEHINEMTNTRGNASPASTDPKLDQDHANCMNQEGTGIDGEANVSPANADAKLDEKYAVRYITRSCGSKKTDHMKSAVVKKENVLTEKAATKEVRASEMKTRRKRKYGSPIALQVEEVTSIVSPELSSIKKSRSGRLLLPTLEFWRNQTAVYGVEHQCIGIKDIITTPSKVEVTPEPKKAEGKSK